MILCFRRGHGATASAHAASSMLALNSKRQSTMKSDIHPIFAECCSDEGAWCAVDKPFHQDGYLYATDGRIIVRKKHRRKDTPKARPASLLHWPVINCKKCHGKVSWVCGECRQNVFCSTCNHTYRYEKTPIDLRDEDQIVEQVVSDYYLDKKYLRLLHKYDAKVFLPIKLLTLPSYFTVDGGIEGLLMPRNKPK